MRAGLAAAITVAGLAASAPPGLRVMRTSPAEKAEPTAVVTVTFDRPVAGQLDAQVDPRSIFTIAPAVQGRVEWRDPITLRFTPEAPLSPSQSYTVTIANTFQAMDGTRLEQPHRFSFRVSGPRVLLGGAAGPGAGDMYLQPDAQFELLISAPVPDETISRLVHLEFDRICPGAGPTARLTVVSQRALTERDAPRFRYAGSWPRDRRTDALRRLVRLAPERPLPAACRGFLVAPGELDQASTSRTNRFAFATYGPLRIESLRCLNDPCPAGWAWLRFSTPVRGTEVLRTVRLDPQTAFTLDDSTGEAAEWMLQAPLRSRTRYRVTVDRSLRDVFGQGLTGPDTASFTTGSYTSAVDYTTGRLLVERESFRTLAVRHVNVDTLYVTLAAVPESLEARILAAPRWNLEEAWSTLQPFVTVRKVPVRRTQDVPQVSAIRMPAYNAATRGSPTLTAVRVSARPPEADTSRRWRSQVSLVQVTNLGVVVRVGADEAAAWVTTLSNGQPAPGATVTLYDRSGRVRATGTSDAQGLVRLADLPPDTTSVTDAYGRGQGYVAAELGSDRAVVALDVYSWELSPWRFNVADAGTTGRIPAAAAVFTERGIYRPGEVVHAKAIARTGALGALRVPGRGDSLRWVFSDREEGKLRDTTVALSPFGTGEQQFPLGADLQLGTYRIAVSLKRGGEWIELGRAFYRVAEYRPPEFLVAVNSDTLPKFGGDTLSATIEARYLFGAPMARAAVQWTARRIPVPAWAISIPGADDYTFGETGYWWEEDDDAPSVETLVNVTDTLDNAGRLIAKLPFGPPLKGRPARVTLQATITDVNRQAVSSSAGATVHPAAFYIGARSVGDEYFWRSGTAQTIGLIAVRPGGQRVPGVSVRGTLVRREWHRVQRSRDGLDEQVGEWVSDTVTTCEVTTAAEPVQCRFTPPNGGTYVVTFRARDPQGREAVTSYYRWATGPGWVPWGDESQFKMDVIPDRTRYDVGDTATVLFASPFTDAEAWITVEREGVLEQRRMRITSGATSLQFPLTEAHVPNVFVSIVVVRGRSAPAGGIADPGRPALRIGYADLRVTPRIKRLGVAVQPLAAEYRPGDSARVRVKVTDAGGTGRRGEVTLWAVDEGVLSLTGYRTPDLVDLLYAPRGVGMRLASDLVAVAPQVLEEEGVSIKGDRAPGGGGGLEGGDVLRSRFSSTAFFLGSVVTDNAGDAVAVAKLPDNLTTFRVMAVAVTAGDRYGSGQSSMLVTRPLLARPALPRFLRRDDRVVAGVVVNQRAGGTPTVTVRANARGVTMNDVPRKTATLAAGRGTEVRFAFRDTTSDSVLLRFDVTDGRDSDAVLTRLPVRPSYVPRAHSAAGVTRLTAGVELMLPGDIDPARSRVVVDVGSSPLALIGGMRRTMAIYPYYCSEQIVGALLPVIALHRAGAAPETRRYAPPDARRQIETAVAVLVRRQRSDGGIGLWSADNWTTPWLSAYAGEALLAARAAGVPVRDSVLSRLADYLYRSVHQRSRHAGPLSSWFDVLQVRLAEDVAAVDFLSRFGRTDQAGENELLRLAPQMAWEDRARLAGVIARRGATQAARRLMEPLWATVRVEGRRAVLPDSAARHFYFWSRQRPVARMLSATLAVDPAHALVGPLLETLVQQGRAAQRSWWNTQDYGAAVEALMDFTARQQRAAARGFTVAGGGRVLFRSDGAASDAREMSSALTGLLAPGPDSTQRLTLTVTAPAADDAAPLYYYVTVHEVPRARPVRPDDKGIVVERWYEDYATGRPITSVQEGSLVRVRLRVRTTSERRFLALSDPLPAGLEAVDLSLRTAGELPGPGVLQASGQQVEDGEEGEGGEGGEEGFYGWYYGSWDSGWWSPFDHRELRDDRVNYFATYLWPGTFTATYVARATTPGVFVRPPAHAEEMYNPAVQGRSDGGIFTVTRRAGG